MATAAEAAAAGYGSMEAAGDNGSDSFGAKSIGLLGGVMLLINSMAGPTVTLMLALAQEAGWLGLTLGLALVGALSAACGHALLEAMRAMPGNRCFDVRVEYTDVVRFYLPNLLFIAVMVMYLTYLTMTLMTYIIQSCQVIDYALLNIFGCAVGIELFPQVGVLCGTDRHSTTPFGEVVVLSGSLAVGALFCTPFALLNLDSNVWLQWLAIGGLTALAATWVCILSGQPDFPQELPVLTASLSTMVSTLLFNFTLATTLPSWVNEKQPGVSTWLSFALSISYVVVVYAILGIVGGMAYKPFFGEDANLFSKLNASGSPLARVTVSLYPVLQNFTSIPVFSILIRYNLLRAQILGPRTATFLAVAVPWALSVPFYASRGFQRLAEFGGATLSPVVNFAVPVAVYVLSQWGPSGKHDKVKEGEVEPILPPGQDASAVRQLRRL